MATKGFELYPAFGEHKTISAWARAPRCRVSRQGLYMRVRVQGLSVEDAFRKGPYAPSGPTGVLLTVHGESKTIPQWARDRRCKVAAWTIRRRLARGWPAAAAVLSRPGARPPREVPRSDKKAGRPAALITAWGEQKTPQQWARDPRARISGHGIVRRMADGFTAEEAIATPRFQRLDRRVGGGDRPCPPPDGP